jgi:SAM-dependent methyltransferase
LSSSRRLAEAARFRARLVAATALDLVEAAAGRGDPLAPPRRLLGDDYSEFERIGEEFLGHFVELGGLEPDHRVLDIGCGLGRMAVPLTRYLSTAGSYEGFDVVEREIDWCRRAIGSRHPNFQFRVLDVRNERYNPGGRAEPRTWPFADATFDFAFAASVFTHLRPADAAAYIAEAARVLRPGGALLATFFVLDDETRPRIERGESYFSFRAATDGPAAADDAASFEAAVAYDLGWVRERFEGAGLELTDLRHGYWSGTKEHLTWQDVIVVRRR